MSRKILTIFGKFYGVGDRIRNLRISLKITQGELAKEIGVKTATISRYEKGRIPDEEILEKMAKFFQVSIEYLLYGEKTRPPLLKALTEAYESRPAQLNSDHLIDAIAFARKYLKLARLKFTDLQEASFITYLYEHWQENQGPPGDLVAKRLAELAEGKKK